MPVTKVEKDPESLTMTVHSEFEAGSDRIWQMWANPRLLERWWGPPTHPAKFPHHDLSPGGGMKYFMTGPEGDEFHGWWSVISVDPGAGIEIEDGFADQNGNPDPSMPSMTMKVAIVQVGEDPEITRMTIETHFQSLEAMEQVLEMGAEEGMSLAIGQIDEMLAAGTS
jgi:uncharacterized protein YndB with AHSA1/START domain